MFDGLTFMAAGNMCYGGHRDDLILRLVRENVVGDLNITLGDFNHPVNFLQIVAANCASSAGKFDSRFFGVRASMNSV
jgi:hypothetical protein